MTADIVIKAEALSKAYTIGNTRAERERYSALRDVAARSARNLSRNMRELLSGRATVKSNTLEEIWALSDVNFEIRRGEVIGIVGRNGAGKSTLLKVLSRITEPTRGRVTLKGRVASLLEVGTGFHPELTGRENIYLNGAILGMSRSEIRSKMDEIITFAEVEKFLDTPVKRYSSGMYVRLAFAVAAHLEPEILIVDEVLAVGDAEFQKKCLGKMQAVSGQGRTVLFVSHNMSAVAKLCEKAILLKGGRVTSFAQARQVVQEYLRVDEHSSAATVDLLLTPPAYRSDTSGIRFSYFQIRNSKNVPTNTIQFKEPFAFHFGAHSEVTTAEVLIGFSIISHDGRELLGSSAHDTGNTISVKPGQYSFEVRMQPNILVPGRYTVRAAIFRPGALYQHIDQVMNFTVERTSGGTCEDALRHIVGDVHVNYPWQIDFVSE